MELIEIKTSTTAIFRVDNAHQFDAIINVMAGWSAEVVPISQLDEFLNDVALEYGKPITLPDWVRQLNYVDFAPGAIY